MEVEMKYGADEASKELVALKRSGVKSVTFGVIGGCVRVTHAEFFPPEPAAIQADAVAKALAELGPEEKMPSDTEMMMWSTGGPIPEVKATSPEDPTT